MRISDCTCGCKDRGRERKIEERALSSINKVLGTEGQAYYPDGTGAVTIPLADADTLNQIDANSMDIASIKSDISELNGEIAQMKISDRETDEAVEQAQADISAHATEITTMKAKDAQQDGRIQTVETEIAALTKELPTDYELTKPGTGKLRLTMEREDSTTLESNTIDMVVPVQYTIFSGTTQRSFRIEVTYSDGSKTTTNDMVIPEGGGTSVSITSVSLQKADANHLQVAVGLDDGDSIKSESVALISSVSGTAANNRATINVNGVVGTVTNLVHSVELTYLQATGRLRVNVNGVASDEITIDTTGTTYEAGSGITISNEVISVDTSVIATAASVKTVDEKVATKADQTTVTQIQTAVGDCFNDVAVSGSSLVLTAVDGQSNSITLPGGDTWRSFNLSSQGWDTWMTTDWQRGDRLMFLTFNASDSSDASFNIYNGCFTYHRASSSSPTTHSFIGSATMSDGVVVSRFEVSPTTVCIYANSNSKIEQVNVPSGVYFIYQAYTTAK